MITTYLILGLAWALIRSYRSIVMLATRKPDTSLSLKHQADQAKNIKITFDSLDKAPPALAA